MLNKKSPGIYFIINLENGKVYVGQTVNMKTRLSGHLTMLRRGCHSNRHLQGSFDLNGEDNFFFYVAEYCDASCLTEREQYWIDFFGPGRVYNMAPAGGSCLGIKHTDETRRKVSSALKGRVQPIHVRVAVSEANRRRVISEETRAKLAEASRRRVVTDETRSKLSAQNKGRPLSDAQKKKLSEARSKKITAFGKSMTAVQWSKETGLTVHSINKRLVYGWTPEDAVSRPRRARSQGRYEC